MKKILITIFILSGIMSIYSQKWNVVSEPDIKSALNAMHFFDANEGYFVGENSLVLYTQDGGKTLIPKTLPSVRSLKKVIFTDKQHGWIGANDGIIFSTTNGGATWSEYDLGTLIKPQIAFLFLDALCFTSDKNGYALAGKLKADYLFQTTDGGASWFVKDSLVSATAMRWYAIEFFGENNGVIVGDKKNIQKYTTDGGKTWTLSTAINDAFFYYLRTVKWLSATTVVAMGDGNEFNGLITPIYKSTDGGKNWVKKTQTVVNYDRVKDSYFKNSNEGIGVGNNGFSKMYYTKTSDGGETWTPYTGDFAMGLTAVCGFGDVLYALGSSAHIIKSTDFGSTWTMLPYKCPSVFSDIEFIGTKGFAACNDGDFYINDNGLGNSWRLAGQTGIWKTSDMAFISEKIGFLQKDNNHIVKTTDGGATWRTVLAPSPFNARSLCGGISFPTPNTGYIWFSKDDYANYLVYKTTDAGENWNQVYQASAPAATGIKGGVAFFDENTGFLAGIKRWFRRTTNGGQTWDTVIIKNIPSTISSGDCEDVEIIDNSTAYVVGSRFILKTTDKGANWTYIDHGMKGIDSSFNKIAFKDANTGYITSNGSSDGGMIYKTTDGGVSWSVDTSLANQYLLYALGVNSNGNVFFGTTDGRILSDVSPVAVKGEYAESVRDFNLKQNYPNPFNPETNITFEIKNGSRVTLKVYDLMGREVAVLINGYKPAGSYNVVFDAKNASGKYALASGVYYYRLQTDGFNETKKMLLMR